MKNKWRFFAVTMAVVLCMTVFSVTAYAGGGDMVDSTMGDPTMETPTATTQPENTNTGEQTPNGQTLTVLVTENADGSHTVTIGDRSWTLPAKREQAGKVVNVRTYLNLRTGPGTDYTVVGRLLNGAEVKVLEESNGWYKVVVPEQTGYVYGKYLDVMNAPTENSGNDTDMVRTAQQFAQEMGICAQVEEADWHRNLVMDGTKLKHSGIHFDTTQQGIRRCLQDYGLEGGI